jgi:hypothetical protein
VNLGIQMRSGVPPHGKEVIAKAYFFRSQDYIAVLFCQAIGERGMVGMMRHARIVRLTEIENPGFIKKLL